MNITIDILKPATKSKYLDFAQNNDTCGGWQIIDKTAYITKNKREGAIYFLCRCIHCQKETRFVNVQFLKRCQIGDFLGGCSFCRMKQCAPFGKQSILWKGTGDISRTYLHNLQHAARLRKIEYKVSATYLWKLFLEQNRKCKLSGVELAFSTRTQSGDGTASLDRIDNNKGYIKGNVQWVHKTVNEMKWDKTDNELVEWCRKISSYKGS